MPTPVPRPSGPDAIAASLVEGNRRFAADEPIHPNLGSQFREAVVRGQHPHTAVVGCADSRVSPELIFDQGIGDLFVCRVAGNVLPPSIVSSLAFAVDSLGVELIVVLGHEGCGAVKATVEVARGRASHEEMAVVVDEILPAVEGILAREPDLDDEGLQRAAVDENIRRTAARLTRLSPTVAAAVESGRTRVISGRYDLDGHVRLLG